LLPKLDSPKGHDLTMVINGGFLLGPQSPNRMHWSS